MRSEGPMTRTGHGSLPAAASTMIVSLPTFWSMLQLGAWWSPPLDAVVFAVMLAVALPRALARAQWRDVPLSAVLFVVGSGVAIGCGMLLSQEGWQRIVGSATFSVGVAVCVWLRRFGPSWQTAGTMSSLPFIAVLVHPAPITAAWSTCGWMLIAAGTAMLWALAARSLSTSPAVQPLGRDRRPSATRPQASTRMAIQLGCATAASFAMAQLLDPDHLVWPVLTTLVVHSANRGRGDVLWKGTQRIVGALVGTGIATLASGMFSPGDNTALVLLFAMLAVAAAFRPFGYVYWAAGITAALSFLYGYFGQSGSDLLGHRLLGILVGGLIGVAAAWFILPIRTVDVTRLRVAAVLKAASHTAISTARAEPTNELTASLAAADHQLAALDTTVRAARLFGIGAARKLRALVNDAHELASLIRIAAKQPDRALLGALGRDIGIRLQDLANVRWRLPSQPEANGSSLSDLVVRARAMAAADAAASSPVTKLG